jgi:hypothetical protein
MQDPRKFYALDSPVFNNSDPDSDQELYKSAEETLEPEDQDYEQVGGNSVGLHVSHGCAWPVSVSTDNPKAAASSATVWVIPVPPRATCTAHVTTPTTFPATIASANVAFMATS